VWAKPVQAAGEEHSKDMKNLLASLAKSTDRFMNYLDKYAAAAARRMA
jgi:hypothetical protein